MEIKNIINTNNQLITTQDEKSSKAADFQRFRFNEWPEYMSRISNPEKKQMVVIPLSPGSEYLIPGMTVHPERNIYINIRGNKLLFMLSNGDLLPVKGAQAGRFVHSIKETYNQVPKFMW